MVMKLSPDRILVRNVAGVSMLCDETRIVSLDGGFRTSATCTEAGSAESTKNAIAIDQIECGNTRCPVFPVH
jgi:hypothetical protein